MLDRIEISLRSSLPCLSNRVTLHQLLHQQPPFHLLHFSLSYIKFFWDQRVPYYMPRKSHPLREQERDLSLEPHRLSSSSSNKYGSTKRRPSSSSSSPSEGGSKPSTSCKPIPSFINRIPSEILAHVFSFLDPRGFAAATLVNRHWYHVASDDFVWKVAFTRFYGSYETISRISASWRGEYIHRSHLLRKWQVGHGPVSLYDTGCTITQMSALPALQKRRQSLAKATGAPLLLSGSTPKGDVKVSDPSTGQVFPVSTAGRRPTNALALRNNIAAFGQHEGQVYIVDVNNRRKVDGGYIGMQQRHNNVVYALHILPIPIKVDTNGVVDGQIGLISGAVDGSILLHDIRTGICHGFRNLPAGPFLPRTTITFLDYYVESNLIIAGTSLGEIWTVHSQSEEDMTRVEGTKHNENDWIQAQEIFTTPNTRDVWLSVDIFYLSDMKNDSIIVIREKSIVRYGIETPSTTRFLSGNVIFTCAAIDPDIPDSQAPRLFVVGDADGTVSVFNARASPEDPDSPIPALYTVIPTPSMSIKALAINPITLITGSEDGTAKTYHTLDGTFIRSLCAPSSRRRHLRPPPSRLDEVNPIAAISLTQTPKNEVRGAIGFRNGSIRYWNFAPDGVGGVIKVKKRRKPRPTAKEIKTFVDDEIERDELESMEEEGRRRQWERMNGGIEEEDVALQVALMMSREEEDRRREWRAEIAEESVEEESEEEEDDEWMPGRKISMGSTSGASSPAVRNDTDRRFEDVLRSRQAEQERQFDEDLNFAIRLSLAEQQSREESQPPEEE